MPIHTPTSARQAPRMLEDETPRVSWQFPETWLRGLLAGAEGVLGTWLIIVVPAIATYVATAAAPQLGSASWMEAARIGTGVWLAGHGAHLVVGDVTFTLIPLGVSLLALALTASAIRRARLDTWTAAVIVLSTYLAGTALLARVAAVDGAYGALKGATVIAALALAWGMRRRYPRVPARVRAWAERLREHHRGWVDRLARADKVRRVGSQARKACSVGFAASTRAIGTILGMATLVVIATVVFAMPLIIAVHGRLEVDIVSSIVLSAVQLLLAPTLIMWAVSYLAGPGFTMGEATSYAPAEVTTGPLPAIPVLGALPSPESEMTGVPIIGLIFISVGVLIGWFIHRRVESFLTGVAAVAAATIMTTAVVTILAVLSTGGFGPERFAADVGPKVGALAGALTWQLAGPAFLIVIAAHPSTHRAFKVGWRRLRDSASRLRLSTG